MAQKRTSRRILESGHDSLKDYSCSLCETDGKQIEASKFCKECLVYLCDVCVQVKHDAFPLNKRHKMLDKTQFSIVKESSLQSFPTKRCTKHPGELINIYCGEHDVVCCIVCKTLEHSNCSKSQHLADVAKGVRISGSACQNIMKETEKFLSGVDKVLEDGELEMARITEAKQQVKKTILNFRKLVNEHFDALEAKSLEKLQALESKINGKIEKDMKNLDAKRTEANEVIQQMKSFKGANECELFVHIKDCEKLLQDAKKTAQSISKSIHKQSIYYEIDPKIEEFLRSLETLGSFTDMPVKAEHHFQTVQDTQTRAAHVIQFETDISVPYDHVSICTLNGDIFVIEKDNKKSKGEIKRYSESCKYIDSVTIPGEPISIFTFDDCHVAVLYERKIKIMQPVQQDFEEYYDEYDGSTPNVEYVGSTPNVEYVGSTPTQKVNETVVHKIGFITVGKNMTLGKIFSFTGKGFIGCSDEKLYVCLDYGRNNPFENEGKQYWNGTGDHSGYIYYNEDGEGCSLSQIAVYDRNGQLLHHIPHSPQLLPFCLQHITISDDGHHIIGYNSSDKTFIKLDPDGNMVDTFGDTNSYSAFCTDGRGGVFGCMNNTIVRLSSNQQKSEVILKGGNANKCPKAICFDKRNSRLWVLYFESSKEKGTPTSIFSLQRFTSK